MSAGPPQPLQNSLEFVFSTFYGVLPMLTSPQESGINHELIRRRGQQQQQQQQQAEAGPSNASATRNQDPINGGEQGEGSSAPSVDVCILVTHTSRPSLTSGLEVPPDSDHLDSEGEAPIGKKRKVSKAALEKQKAAAKKRAKRCNDDDDECDDDGDEYTALSKSLKTNKSGNPKPPIGSLEKCAKCSKQFTVVCSFGHHVARIPIYDW